MIYKYHYFYAADVLDVSGEKRAYTQGLISSDKEPDEMYSYVVAEIKESFPGKLFEMRQFNRV
jgi:hypothetical protein